MPERDELYTVARTVLLDALEALGAHREALVLVGAQAIYLRVGEADLAVAPYTTDGDLAIDQMRISGFFSFWRRRTICPHGNSETTFFTISMSG